MKESTVKLEAEIFDGMLIIDGCVDIPAVILNIQDRDIFEHIAKHGFEDYVKHVTKKMKFDLCEYIDKHTESIKAQISQEIERSVKRILGGRE